MITGEGDKSLNVLFPAPFKINIQLLYIRIDDVDDDVVRYSATRLRQRGGGSLQFCEEI